MTDAERDDAESVARAVADGRCWLPFRCPGRGYCTMFHEGSFKAPCWDEADAPRDMAESD
jgi:hypothetical protein